MDLRILTQEDVQRLLPMKECVTVVADALRATSRGEAVLPLRSMVWMPDRTGLIGLMPGYLGAPKSLGLKVVSIFPGNEGSGHDSHQGAVLLFDTRVGSLIAVMDASSITGIRTAAVSGVATQALAREDAGDLAILGSGVQAITHLEAMAVVRRLRRVRVWSRNAENARRFAAREGKRHGLAVEAMPTAREAVRGADLVCTVTAAREPILEGEWISPGAHVNAVGACFPTARELDTAAVKRSRLFVDRRESALNEAGDLLIARREGAFGDEHILGELGDVLLGRVAGRGSPDDVTLFKSLGIAVEDLAAAHHVHQKALAAGAGVSVALGGRRLASA
ncbi:MAG TPA: ornithine cyclodeaminase family protein [Candidatus Eisenbacteria bacterium]|jgi:ornithine cyclodeaminase